MEKLNLNSLVSEVKGVGPKMTAKMNKLGIFSIGDLLLYFPRRYEDFTETTQIDEIPAIKRLQNSASEVFTIRGEIVDIANKKTRRRGFAVTEATVIDGTGSIKVVWFNQAFLARMLKPGSSVILSGKVNFDYFSKGYVMESPVRSNRPKIIPVYSETEGISSWYINKLVNILKSHINAVEEYLPLEFLNPKSEFQIKGHNKGMDSQIHPSREASEWHGKSKDDNYISLMSIQEAIAQLHFPTSSEKLEEARKRMAFEELFFVSIKANLAKEEIEHSQAPMLAISLDDLKAFIASLPFKLTNDQKRAIWQIIQDMEKGAPMNRLLNGDVGSGKTIVAAIAAYVAVKAGFKTAFMCPTSILANQHYESFCRLFKEKGISVGLVTGDKKILNSNSKLQIKNQNPKSKTANCQLPTADILIGTHALLNLKDSFDNLGLVVVDEQHRFGVKQRQALKELSITNYPNFAKASLGKQLPINDQLNENWKPNSVILNGSEESSGNAALDPSALPQDDNINAHNNKKGLRPHFLSMTATPIPRTLHLALFGDLDISVIREKPANRKEIKTRFVESMHREKAYEFVREQIEGGRQAFVICPLIEENQSQKSKVESQKFNSKSKNNGVILSETKNLAERLNSNAAFDLDPSALPQDDNASSLSLFEQEKKTVVGEAEKLKTVFPEFRIEILHGKIKSKEKDEIMHRFSMGEIDLLVSTSVVEVGVDIPNASIMLIEDAERFGLAQLHQFRGRVGRGEHQSYCFLFSSTMSEKAKTRLKGLENINDGFRLAELDLEMRGSGSIFGTEQSGLLDLKFANFSDQELIREASEAAKTLVKADPELKAHPLIKKKIADYFASKHLE